MSSIRIHDLGIPDLSVVIDLLRGDIAVAVSVLLVFILLRTIHRNKIKAIMLSNRLNAVEYAPPKDFRPAYLMFARGGISDWGSALGATLVDLTLRGYLAAEATPSGVVFKRTAKDAHDGTHAFEERLLTTVFLDRARLEVPEEVPDLLSGIGSDFYDHVFISYNQHFVSIDDAGRARAYEGILRYLIAGAFVTFLAVAAALSSGLIMSACLLLITIPYLAYVLLIWTAPDEPFARYYVHSGVVAEYERYLRKVFPGDQNDVDPSSWTPETPYVIALGLGGSWAKDFVHHVMQRDTTDRK